MTVYCLGSINIDHFYRLASLPRAGETLSARSHSKGLGGKGANQSIAALRAGAEVVHIGAIGQNDPWIEAELTRHGLSLDAIARSEAGTGHAIVAVDEQGENQIIIFSGANFDQSPVMIARHLARAHPGDSLLLQNETSHQMDAAALGRARGMKVFYSAAPFDLSALQVILPNVTHLLVNQGEAAQLVAASGVALNELPVEAVVVTKGAQGAEWVSRNSEPLYVPSFKVAPVDTTGAGDCFAGSLVASLDAGMPPAEAMRFASAAAALQVTKPGTADAMPNRANVVKFLENFAQ